jgi:hypothetical protein
MPGKVTTIYETVITAPAHLPDEAVPDVLATNGTVTIEGNVTRTTEYTDGRPPVILPANSISVTVGFTEHTGNKAQSQQVKTNVKGHWNASFHAHGPGRVTVNAKTQKPISEGDTIEFNLKD